MEQVRVLATGLRSPKGLVFDSVGNLWCAEHEAGRLMCRNVNGRIERIQTGGAPCGLALDKQGNIWFSDTGQNAIRCFSPDTGQTKTVIDSFGGLPLNHPKDLIFDKAGNLIFTCPGLSSRKERQLQDQGIVLVFTNSGLLQIVADELSYPNGLTLIRDMSRLLIAEMQKQRIWCGFWDAASPSWDTIDVWANTGHTLNDKYGPNGMVVSPKGLIYVTIFGAGAVNVYNDDGDFLRVIPLPGRRPTKGISDPNGKFLIVSETERGELFQIQFQ